MTRIQLRLYRDPSEVEVFCNFLRKDNFQEKTTAIIDTGAAVSLFPQELLEFKEHRRTSHERVVIDQAGVAGQSFEAIEAYVTITLEDQYGNLTEPFEVLVWFANTRERLIGFANVLERAVLHIDSPVQNAWIEL